MGAIMASSVKIHCLTLSVRRQAKLRFLSMLSRKCIITTVKVIQLDGTRRVCGQCDGRISVSFSDTTSLRRLHSQLAHTSLRQKYAVNDREPVMIHPEDAAARGIKDGDIVRVHSKRGQVLAGAVVTENIIKGTVALHEAHGMTQWT